MTKKMKLGWTCAGIRRRTDCRAGVETDTEWKKGIRENGKKTWRRKWKQQASNIINNNNNNNNNQICKAPEWKKMETADQDRA